MLLCAPSLPLLPRSRCHASRVCDRLEPPYIFNRQGLSALVAYWVGVTLWSLVVPPPPNPWNGCPHDARGWAYLLMEIAAALVAYDATFFWLHLAMHRVPAFGHLVSHSRHHEHDGRIGSSTESSYQTVHHSLADEALQVLVNVLVQRSTPWAATKSRLA